MFSASRFDRRRTRNCVFKFNRLRVAPNEQRYAFRMNFFVVQIFGNYSFLFRLLWMWCRLTLTAESTAIDKDYVAQLARQTCGFRVIDALIFVRSRIKCVPNDRLPSFPFIYFVFFSSARFCHSRYFLYSCLAIAHECVEYGAVNWLECIDIRINKILFTLRPTK